MQRFAASLSNAVKIRLSITYRNFSASNLHHYRRLFMSNSQQNANQKTQDSLNSNQSKQGVNSGQKDQMNANDRSAAQQKDGNKFADANKAGGMKNDAQGSDARRERQDSASRTEKKAGNQ